MVELTYEKYAELLKEIESLRYGLIFLTILIALITIILAVIYIVDKIGEMKK